MPLVILGIDPGLANTGWGVIECDGSLLRCRGFGCVSTDSDADVSQRLLTLHRSLQEVLVREQPHECAIENVFFSRNARTAFATGQARGVALLAVASSGLAIEDYGPGEVKMAVTGYGAADKRQVARMVRSVLRLPQDPEPDHAADALAVALCHANGRGVRRAIASSRTAEAGA